MAESTLNMPVLLAGERACIIVGDRIAFIKVDTDDDVDNPLQWGGSEIIALRDSTPSADIERAEKVRRTDPDAVELSYFEHGRSIWDVRGSLDGTPDFRWDGVSLAGVWIPGRDLKDEALRLRLKKGSPERRAWMEERAKGDCKAWTAYVNGDVYCYELNVYPLKRRGGAPVEAWTEYKNEAPVAEDWCGGHYGDEALCAGVREAVRLFTAE